VSPIWQESRLTCWKDDYGLAPFCPGLFREARKVFTLACPEQWQRTPVLWPLKIPSSFQIHALP